MTKGKVLNKTSFCAIFTSFPSNKNNASFFKAFKAAKGDQLNLYPKGLSQTSGQGTPPHHDS